MPLPVMRTTLPASTTRKAIQKAALATLSNHVFNDVAKPLMGGAGRPPRG